MNAIRGLTPTANTNGALRAQRLKPWAYFCRPTMWDCDVRDHGTLSMGVRKTPLKLRLNGPPGTEDTENTSKNMKTGDSPG